MPIREIVVPEYPVCIKIDNYSLLPNDCSTEIQFSSASAVTCTLLATAEGGNGYNIILRNIGSGTLTIDPYGAETIDGASSLALALGDWCWILSDGTQWRSIACNPPVGRGQWDFISRTVLSSDANYELTSSFAGYDAIQLQMIQIQPATNFAELYALISIASSWQTGSTYDTAWKQADQNNYDGNVENTAHFQLHNTTPTASNATDSTGYNGTLTLYGINNTADFKGLVYDFQYRSSAAGDRPQRVAGAGRFNGNAGAIDGIRLVFSNGNMAAGAVSAWGLNQS